MSVVANKLGFSVNLPRPPVTGDLPGLYRWAQDVFAALFRVLADLSNVLQGAKVLNAYAKADLPPAADHVREFAYVTDEVGGATPAFSDGVDWRRFSDRAIVS